MRAVFRMSDAAGAADSTACCTTSFTPPFSERSGILNSVRASNFAWLPPAVHSNCSEWTQGLFWLPWRIILVGQGSRIEVTQNLPDVRFLDIRFLVLSFAYASTKRECNAVSTIADEGWQYRRGGNLTILTKITTLQKQSSCSQACGFATITMYSWWQPGEIGCAYRI